MDISPIAWNGHARDDYIIFIIHSHRVVTVDRVISSVRPYVHLSVCLLVCPSQA